MSFPDSIVIARVQSKLYEPPDEELEEPCKYCKGRCRCAEYEKADAERKYDD